jgi:protein dithiol oxidoreductase (disulfide-forming)
MKNLLVHVFLAAFLLSGCGSEQSGSGNEPVADLPRDAESEAPAEAIAPPPADDKTSTPTLVEESSADVEEPASDEVPLLLAQADTSAARDWQFKDGTHFQRLVPTQPTIGGADKVEVAEIFWYGCNHCRDFEPIINRWDASKPANARFVRIPAMWNPLVKLHAQLYYTEEVLAKNGKLKDHEAFRTAVFAEYHQKGNRMASEAAIQPIFERFGVSAEDFSKTWKSFEVAQKMNLADDLTRRYGITGVPAIVVNGKYRTGAGEAGGYPRLIQLINELIERESIR